MRRRVPISTSREGARSALLLFNEKAELLQSSSLVKQLRKNKQLSVHLKYTARRTSVKATTVRHDPIAAFVLTLRFFLQDNEATSLRRLALLYSEKSLPIPDDLRERFRAIRQRLNEFLDSPGALGILQKGETKALTRRMVLDAFMWGDLAHATHDKSQRHRALRLWLKKDPMFEPLARHHFIGLLWDLSQVIGFVRDVNLEALKHLERAEAVTPA